jgi:hypothetical protein
MPTNDPSLQLQLYRRRRLNEITQPLPSSAFDGSTDNKSVHTGNRTILVIMIRWKDCPFPVADKAQNISGLPDVEVLRMRH